MSDKFPQGLRAGTLVWVNKIDADNYEKWYYLEGPIEVTYESPGSPWGNFPGWTGKIDPFVPDSAPTQPVAGSRPTCTAVRVEEVGRNSPQPGCITRPASSPSEKGAVLYLNKYWVCELFHTEPVDVTQDRRPNQTYHYRIETFTRQIIGSTITKPVVQSGTRKEWSDKSPWQLGWYAGKKFESPQWASNASVPASTTMTKRPKGQYKFNLPIHVHAVEGLPPPGKLSWWPGLPRATDEVRSRLVTIVVPDYLVNLTPEEQKGLYKYPWGFRALLNPTTWGYDGTIDESVTLSQAIMAKTAPLTPGTFSYRLELFLYRAVDLDWMRVKRRELGLEPGADISTTYLDQWAQEWYGPGSWTGNWWSSKSFAGSKGIGGHRHPLLELERWGTEYDIDFLYRVINGDPRNDDPGITGNRWTSNRSLLSSSRVRISIGTADVFEGQIRGISAKHLILTRTMVPTVTMLTLDIQRWPGFASDASGTGPAATESATQGLTGSGSANLGTQG